MAKEICISTTPHETRLAIVEDDQLTEIYYERENEYTLAGSIYKGKVTRVLPGMQSAFVDLGLERDAFLYVTDFLEEQEDSEEFTDAPPTEIRKERPEGGRGARRGGGRPSERGPDRGADRSQERPDRPVAAVERSEPAGSAAAEAEGEPGEETGGEGFQQGTRRWRGRRGRRRGVRGRVAGQASGGDAEATEEQGDGERGRYSPVSIEAEAEKSPERAASESPRGESSRAGRSERGRPQQGSPAITLPGEALQKYGQQPPSSELEITPLAEAPEVRQPQVTVRPSTLVEHPIAWDGVSVALPGETLSRHRGQSAAHPASDPGIAEQGHA
ncbi:MAG TPA: ribonuclease, partial [Acidobacteriaceae bacterium]|nr:ribonuclease [Acidobacteriaceae bacterium]